MTGGRFAITLLCYAGVVVGHWLVQSLVGHRGVQAQLVAGVVTFLVAIAVMLAFRSLQGRLSYVAYTLMAASTLPLVIAGVNVVHMLSGQSFWLVLAAVLAPLLLLMVLLERALYTSEERAQLRNIAAGRTGGGGKLGGDGSPPGASRP